METQPVDIELEEGQYAEADLPLHLGPVPPPQGKRTLDNELCFPTSGAQKDANGKTPKKRKTAASLPPHVKRNVVREVATVRGMAAEDSAQCVVSGASEQRTVMEFCHVVSDSTPPSEMDCLEWSWRRKYLSLNVDTRKNIQTLSVDLDWLFNAMKNNKPTGWFWIPTDDNLALLNIMHLVYVGNQIITPTAGETSNKQRDPETFYNQSTKFTYRFIPLPDMSESCSVRRYNGEFHGPLDPKLIQYSLYPFNDLPNFELHVPYHFVIVNTGKKLFQLYGLDEIDFEKDFSFLQGEDLVNTRTIMMILRNIYVAWNLAKPDPTWLTGEEYTETNHDPPVDRTRQ